MRRQADTRTDLDAPQTPLSGDIAACSPAVTYAERPRAEVPERHAPGQPVLYANACLRRRRCSPAGRRLAHACPGLSRKAGWPDRAARLRGTRGVAASAAGAGVPHLPLSHAQISPGSVFKPPSDTWGFKSLGHKPQDSVSVCAQGNASARASLDPRARSGNGRSGRAVRLPSAVRGLGRVRYGHAAAEGPGKFPPRGESFPVRGGDS